MTALFALAMGLVQDDPRQDLRAQLEKVEHRIRETESRLGEARREGRREETAGLEDQMAALQQERRELLRALVERTQAWLKELYERPEENREQRERLEGELRRFRHQLGEREGPEPPPAGEPGERMERLRGMLKRFAEVARRGDGKMTAEAMENILQFVREMLHRPPPGGPGWDEPPPGGPGCRGPRPPPGPEGRRPPPPPGGPEGYRPPPPPGDGPGMPPGPPDEDAQKVERLERACRETADRLRRTREEGPREELKKKLLSLVGELFDLREARRAKEIERLGRSVEELKRKLQTRRENRDRIIEKRVRELLGERDPLDW